MKYYTGVGSRENKLPEEIGFFMTAFAHFMANRGYILRSGHASGADYAFELGAGHKAEIYLPWDGFNSELDLAQNHTSMNYIVPEITKTHMKIVDEIHHFGYEKLKKMRKGGDKFHSRNVNQVLGADVDNPVLSDLLVCWTPDGAEKDSHCNVNTGGTGTAIKLACKRGVPVFNLRNEDCKGRLEAFCKEKGMIK